MKISELFGKGRPIFSFEVYPPKTEAGAVTLQHTLAELTDLAPAFVSVTYGAGGSTIDRTVDLVTRVQHEHSLLAMAHMTGMGSGQAEVAALIDRLVDAGIENLIPLRGDPPAGVNDFVPRPGAFAHASDLVTFIRQRYGQRLCLAGAGYPEGHPQCRDLALDMQHLVTKVRAGVDFIITQLFFDNRFYFDFVARARAAGITVPIVPGIMPITDVAQIQRMTQMCGASVPAVLRAELEKRRTDKVAVAQLGVAQATAQCVDLLLGGAPGVHFYTLNQSPATRMILTVLKARL
ncbi:MAG TPA: methylenetetrahydrofolate reductase [NAD(P)H] [Polyangia bacterium]|jgi:5,10-methylenetetrahydrofolate reductase, prokaryotic form|nr:methylenetetrahydrofolate reductase [NAD(P)H] [Polyangia bacterium]